MIIKDWNTKTYGKHVDNTIDINMTLSTITLIIHKDIKHKKDIKQCNDTVTGESHKIPHYKGDIEQSI